MRHSKTLLAAAATATLLLLGGCRSGSGTSLDRFGNAGGNGNGGFMSDTLTAAQAEITNNTSETATPRDATTIGNREDDPETALPVAVTFPAGT